LCQKHPSTKIAILYFGKIKSGEPTSCLLFLLQPFILLARKILIKAISVLLLFFPLIAAIFFDLCFFVCISTIVTMLIFSVDVLFLCNQQNKIYLSSDNHFCVDDMPFRKHRIFWLCLNHGLPLLLSFSVA